MSQTYFLFYFICLLSLESFLRSSFTTYNKEIIVSIATFNSGSTIAVSATCGWQMTKTPIIVQTVVFAELGARKISNIAMIVGCASTKLCTTITIAKMGNTSQIVQFARSFSSAPGAPLTKCPVAMRFIGNASDSWRLTTHDVPFAKRPQRQRRE